jgi:uncharacterized protein YdeI (YjbR/CyaY-like superfamily)
LDTKMYLHRLYETYLSSMNELDHFHFSGLAAFHHWLKDNHDVSPGIWLIFYKKHTGMESIAYQDALEEALCFGWIDSLIKKLDDDRYARKFTPRTNPNKWSEINKKIMARLIKEGRMTGDGMKKIDPSLLSFTDQQKNTGLKEKEKRELEVPEFMMEEYAVNEPALHNFTSLPASCKREYVLWITQAKREETIRKRLIESVEMLKENKKLGLK